MRRLLFASALALPLASLCGASLAEAAAAPSAVSQALLHQARYWRTHGRPDLAEQSLARLMIADPENTVAQSRLHRLAPAPSADQRASGLTARGFRTLDSGDLGAAESLFRGALAAAPNDPNALGGLGLVELKSKRFDEAEALLARSAALGTDGRWAEPLATARFYAALDRVKRARDAGALDEAGALASELASSAYPDRGLAQNLAADIGVLRARKSEADALAAWRGGDPKGTEQAFRQALGLAPDDAWIRYGYAGFLRTAQRVDEAQDVMRPLRRSASPQARFALAIFLDETGRPAEAAEALDTIASADRTADMRRFELQLHCELAVRAARALGQVGRSRTAIAGLQRIAQDPDLPTGALSQLADGLYELGDHAGAARLTDQALARKLSTPSDYEGAVSVLARSGRSSEAQALIARLAAASDGPECAVELQRLHARAALGAADRYSRRGELAEAIKVLRTQLAETTDDPELLGALGRAYLAAGRSDRAMQIFDALTKLRPTDEGAWRGLTAAALEARDLQTARRGLDQARRLSPDDAEILLASAELDRAMGNNRAAVAELNAAVAMRERARDGKLDGYLDPQTAERTRSDFDMTAAHDKLDPEGERLRERLERSYDLVSQDLQPAVGWAQRSGEAGLSRLTTTVAAVSALAPLGRGRIEGAVRFEQLDAGQMSATAAERFGVGPLAPATPVAAKTRTSGGRVELAYAADDLRLGLGVIHFADRPTQLSADVLWTPRLTNDLRADFAVWRRPVTESLLAYAGTSDPRAGVSWGQVSRSGAHAGLTLSHKDKGVYGLIAADSYEGRNLRANASAQLDVGGYARLLEHGATSLTGGLNVDVQAYRRNENAFTFGHGGYFSPQQFVSVTAPLHLVSRSGNWRVDARIAPGYSRYAEGDTPVFPTVPSWQVALPPERSVITGARKSGFGASGEALVEYAFSPRLLVRAQAGGDTFGAYRETHAWLSLRLRFGAAR
jgi:tetratricopeptide (TPR) repeat protein